MNSVSHPHFVPNAALGSRQRTATLLVGTAREFGIAQQDIRSTRGGFYISQALASVLQEECGTDYTSGNRAGKNTGTSRKEQE